jgi:hypothetical protein
MLGFLDCRVGWFFLQKSLLNGRSNYQASPGWRLLGLPYARLGSYDDPFLFPVFFES